MQNDLISRSALIKKCNELSAIEWNQKAAPVSWADAYEHFADETENAPGVDAVKVVRCKECKHYHKKQGWCDEHSSFIDDRGVKCHPWESNEWRMFDANDFCSYGERRGDDGK